MTTPADQGSGTHEHQGDKELQEETRERGSSTNPSNARPGGEKVFPKTIASFGLRQSHYDEGKDWISNSLK